MTELFLPASAKIAVTTCVAAIFIIQLIIAFEVERLRYEAIKKRAFEIVQVAEKGDKLSRAFDLMIITLIIANVVAIIAGTFPLPGVLTRPFVTLELATTAIFSVEYAARIWTADLLYPQLGGSRARVRFIFSWMALIDLLAILPFYLVLFFPVDLLALRILRILRLIRLFKMNRYTRALADMSAILKDKSPQLLSSVFVVSLLMIVAAVVMYYVENSAQPEVFNNAFAALWWAIATLTTIGYGDIYPVTAIGKILSAIIALLGIGLVAVPTGIISAGFIARLADKDDNRFCPFCGQKLDCKDASEDTNEEKLKNDEKLKNK